MKEHVVKLLISLFLISLLVINQAIAQPEAPPAQAETNPETLVLKDPENLATYLLAPGDALEITVWKEEGLQQQQFLIGPDGVIK